jgi:excisionase family DNA binding protein
MRVFFITHLAKDMLPRPEENAIMTIGEVADYLKVTERTIYRLAGTKQIPGFKVGGSWRFSKVGIDGWIKEQSVIYPANQ